MPCKINLSLSELSDMIKTKNLTKLSEIEVNTIEDMMELDNFIDDAFEYREVTEAQLKNKSIPTDLGKARVYGVKTTDTVIEKTSTTESRQNFIKSKGKARAAAISAKRENQIKKNSGLIGHDVMDNIITNLVLTDNKYKDKFLFRRPKTVKSKEQILSKINAVSEKKTSIYKVFELTARAILDEMVTEQNKIDPNGKMYIKTEDKSFAPFKKGKRVELIAGTMDLVMITSDLNAHLYDYKFLSPNPAVVDENKNITDPTWIPFYDYNSWDLQMSKFHQMLKFTGHVKGIKKARIIPFHIEHGWDLIDSQYVMSDKINYLASFATKESSDTTLDQVPVGEEAGSKIKPLQTLLSNAKLELEKTKYSSNPDRVEYLKNRIKYLHKAINSMIVRQDMRAMIEDYRKNVVNKYSNISEDYTFNSLNVDDLDLAKVVDLLKEVSVIRDLLTTSEDFYSAIGVDDKSIINAYKDRRNRLLLNLNSMAEALKIDIIGRLERSTGRNDIGKSLENFDPSKFDFLTKQFNTLSELDHEAFRILWEYTSEAHNKTRLNLQSFKEEFDDILSDLEQNSGSKGLGVFDEFINKETGNLYGKFNKSFKEALQKAVEDKNFTWLKEHYQLKDNAGDILENRFNTWKRNHFASSEDEETPQGKKDIERWRNLNNIEAALASKYAYIYYELKPEYREDSTDTSKVKEVYSSEYMNIYNNPSKRKFYEFWTDTMRNVRKLYGMDNEYEQLPDNMIPWIRREVIESIFNGETVHNVGETIRAFFHYTTDDFSAGEFGVDRKVDVSTNEVLYDIPRAFIRPLINSKGEIDKTLKSFDLGKSLYTIMETALWYHNMMNIEAEVNTVGLLMDNNLFKGEILMPTDPKSGKNLAFELYKTHVKSVMYGVNIQDTDPQLAKILTNLNTLSIFTQFAGKFVLQTSASIAAKMNQIFEAKKGFNFDSKQWGLAEKDLVKAFTNTDDGKLLSALINVFEPHNPRLEHRAGELSPNWVIRQMDKGLMMIGFRKGSEWINQTVFLAMLRNYGIDENGNIRRLKHLGEGAKSLMDRAFIKDGKLQIEGMMDENGNLNLQKYTIFRNMVVATAKGIHGEMSQGDINAVNTQMLGKLLMTYKNWLPTMTKERFQGMVVSSSKDVITIGRLNALYQENIKRIWDSNLDADKKKWLSFMQLLFSTIGKMILTIVPFGSHFIDNKYTLRTSSNRAEQLFNKFKVDNPNTTINGKPLDKISKEEFIDYYNGQINASIAELKTILFFVGMLVALGGDWDDDGKKDWKETWATRRLYRVINRVRRELGFFYGSDAVYVLIQNPLPIASYITNAQKLMTKSWHETMDFALNRDDRSNEKSLWEVVFPLIPGYQIIPTFYDPFNDEKKEF